MHMESDKCRRKAMKIVAAFQGIYIHVIKISGEPGVAKEGRVNPRKNENYLYTLNIFINL
jgi:hypothetical protein